MPVREYNHQNLNHEITITFLCANSGKGKSATDIILLAAWEAETDVLLLQEPWAARKEN